MTAASSPDAEPEILTDFHEHASRHVLPDWILEHLQRYEEDPDQGHLWDGTAFGGYPNTPTLLLTTRGRKSGRPLAMPLLYGRDGDRLVICGSKGGAPSNPAWILNLEASPDVEVQVAREKFKAVATIVRGPERERLWNLMVQVYPPFPSYQARTEREIPVVVLERKS